VAKAIIKDQADIPEHLAEEYVEKDGVWALKIEGIKDHPDTKPLQNALDNAKKERKEAKEALEAIQERINGLPEDFNHEKYEQLQAQAAGGDPVKIDARLQKQREELETKHKKELDPLNEKLTKREKALRKTKIEEGLRKNLLDAGVDKVYLEAVTALLIQRGKINLVEEGDDFVALADDGVNDRASLTDYVRKWAESDEGKPYIAKATGGGAGGGGGTPPITNNPWAKETRNLTRQQELIQTNPARAKQLAAAAGETLVI
jgi:hypothetical protein